MKQGMVQSQALRQEMKLAPRMLQALRFLQAPLPELRELIRAELEQNPVLEEAGDLGETVLSPPEPLVSPGDDVDAQNDFESDDFRREIDAFEQMVEPSGAGAASSPEAEEKRQFFMDSLTEPVSLYAMLEEQLNGSGLDAAHKRAGKQIIGNLDANGWLTVDLAEIARAAEVAESAAAAALAEVQEFDPAGVAARNLQECLLIQLRRAGQGADSPAARLVKNHLAQLGELSAQEMAEAAGMSEADVVAAMGLIQSLDPRPGLKYSAPPPMYVMPEVEIRGSPELGYVVEMLKDTWPRLYISEDYQEMLADPETAEEARKYLTEKIRDGKFVLDSLQQRQETVQRIALEIAETQAEFFEHGITQLKPLTLSSVAEKLGVHDTTVGRAVADKYVKTPQGVFELKFFFPSGVKTADGGAMAAAAVKERLARLIVREDVRKPLSDQALAKRLGEQGIPIARRTVAKYREELGLPPAHQRK